MGMNVRRSAPLVALALLSTLPMATFTAADDVLQCAWGGGPTVRSGTFTITPGAKNVPSAGPLALDAGGALGGSDPRCVGEMRIVGDLFAGSSCFLFQDGGDVSGLPGVAQFRGVGNALAPALLLDEDGRVVGDYVLVARSSDAVPFKGA
ncbi:MAG: hypothetical protein ACT4PT_14600 [Methanobacteriota archaeon]